MNLDEYMKRREDAIAESKSIAIAARQNLIRDIQQKLESIVYEDRIATENTLSELKELVRQLDYAY